jgi:FkbM family methyltransferase
LIHASGCEAAGYSMNQVQARHLDAFSHAAASSGANTDACPFGEFAPTPAQTALIGLANATALGRGRSRWLCSDLIEWMRPGVIDVERFGFNLRLDHRGARISEKKMLLKVADYDRQELAHLLSHVRDDFHFADLGAAAGLYSFAVKARCPSAKVVAFEPNPTQARLLDFNARTNSLADFHVLETAVGAERGVGRYHTERDSLLGDGDGFDVAIVPLHDALRENGFTRLDGMKIDVEGYEDRVLFPFFETASPEFRPEVIIIEHIESFRWERDCLALCASLGYRTVWSGSHNSVLERP